MHSFPKFLNYRFYFPFWLFCLKFFSRPQNFAFIFLQDYVIFVIVIIMKKRKRILYPYSNFCARMVGGFAHHRFINNPVTNYLRFRDIWFSARKFQPRYVIISRFSDQNLIFLERDAFLTIRLGSDIWIHAVGWRTMIVVFIWLYYILGFIRLHGTTLNFYLFRSRKASSYQFNIN